MTSIRRDLTLWLLATIAMLLVVVAGALVWQIRAALTAQFDDTLRGRLAAMQSALRWDGEKVDLDFVSDSMPWYQIGPDAEYFEVRELSSERTLGRVICGSPSLAGGDLDDPDELVVGVADARLPDGKRGRIARGTFAPAPEEDLDLPGKEAARATAAATAPTVLVSVAMSRGRLDATLRTVSIAFGLAGLCVVGGLIVAVRVVLARGLSPLRQLSREVHGIRPDTLSTRISGAGLPEELLSIQSRLNELLERLEAAFERERRFTAAAAHEFRTPIAELRSLLEVHLSRQRTAEDSHAVIERALAITIRTEGLVRALLDLARQQKPTRRSALETVDLGPVLSEIVDRHRDAARDGHGEIECDVVEGLEVRADRAALAIVLDNLFANAVEHARPRPIVRCEARLVAPGQVVVDVSNPVDGLDPADLDRFFEPFWRRSDSRSDRTHLGLGLAVARGLAETMNGTLGAASNGDGRIRMRLTLAGGVTEPVEAPLSPSIA